jgi:DNA-binding transcriptional LysR family regulator
MRNGGIELILLLPMRNIPPIHLIVAFDAVARRQSFNKAADDLNLSNSAVSHRIRELEQLLSATLFHRTTRTVTLSAEGAYLHHQMRSALDTLEAAFSGFARERDVVRISVLPSFARFRLVPALTEFHRTHPQISIAILPTTRTVNIAQGEADIAIRFARETPEAFHCERLLEDEWFPVAAPRYLQQLGHRSVPELFKRADILTHSRQPWDPWLATANIRMSSAQRNVIYSDTGFMLDAALNLQGIALGRRSLVKGLLRDGSLVRVSDVSIPAEQAYFLMASERALLSRHGSTVMNWVRTLVVDG